MGFDSVIELLKQGGVLATKGPGPIVVIVIALILAASQILSARGGRLRIREPQSLREAITKLEDWLHTLINPKVRVQIVDHETGQLLIAVPATLDGLFKLAGYLVDRHGANIHALGYMRPFLTRREKARLAGLRRRVEARHRRVGDLLSKFETQHQSGGGSQAEATARQAVNAMTEYMDQAVDFERQLVRAIQNSLNYYQECLLSS